MDSAFEKWEGEVMRTICEPSSGEINRRLLVAALVAAMLVTAVGCGSGSGNSSATLASTTKSATTAAQQTPATNRVGSSVTLPAANTKLAVKVLKVIDPLPAPKQTGPYAGDRVLAVALSLRNVGTKTYTATPADAGSMRSTGGEGAPNAPFTSGRCAKLEHPVKLAPGRTATGCLAFDLLPSQNAATFDFSAGAGHPPGEWHL